MRHTVSLEGAFESEELWDASWCQAEGQTQTRGLAPRLCEVQAAEKQLVKVHKVSSNNLMMLMLT